MQTLLISQTHSFWSFSQLPLEKEAWSGTTQTPKGRRETQRNAGSCGEGRGRKQPDQCMVSLLGHTHTHTHTHTQRAGVSISALPSSHVRIRMASMRRFSPSYHEAKHNPFLIYLFIHLFLVVLGLCCCMDFFSSCSEWGLLGLLIVVTFLVAEHGLSGMWASVVAAHGLSSCGSQALEHRLNSCGTWA